MSDLIPKEPLPDVLLVEADRAIRFTLQALLEEMGTKVVTCPTAEDALAVLASRAWTMVICDLSLSVGAVGLEVARATLLRFPKTHVLATGVSKECASTLMNEGIRCLLPPWTAGDFCQAVSYRLSSAANEKSLDTYATKYRSLNQSDRCTG
ncbi:response regulator [Pseudomonas sp. CJQ_13]|uniref:response regulator n=1 Tax=Pseudomonas sp. CJQ_13 TaxID=3367170 RepID=UPI00370B3B25